MPLSGGAEIFNEIRRWSPDTKVVVFSSVTAPGVLARLIEAGVDGMFSKGGSNALLYQKLPLILRGGKFIAPDCLALIGDAPPQIDLTPREEQTLQMVLRGRTTKEIAEAQAIVDLFAANPGVGAIGYKGGMLDRPHLSRAKQLLRQT